MAGFLRAFWAALTGAESDAEAGEAMKIGRMIIGLGNPGPDYAGTRHNVGYAVVDAIAEARSLRLEKDRANALTALGSHRGRRFGVAKPLTFMNLSGEAVRGLMRSYGLAPDDFLVVYDDIALEAGRLRLRGQGSAGGHNGVQSIIDRIGTDIFPRLRVGIGSDFSRGRQSDYVLSPFSPDQQVLVDEAVLRARDAALTFVTDGLTTAMNRFNR